MALLVLVRHAKAEPARPGQADIDRPLAPRGHADATVAVGLMAARDLPSPITVLVSPAVRTQETYAALQAGLPAHARLDVDRLYEASVSTILDVIAAVMAPGADGTVIVIGHNPTMRDLASHLSGSALAHFPTCGIAELRGSFGHEGSGDWDLVTLAIPRADGD